MVKVRRGLTQASFERLLEACSRLQRWRTATLFSFDQLQAGDGAGDAGRAARGRRGAACRRLCSRARKGESTFASSTLTARAGDAGQGGSAAVLLAGLPRGAEEGGGGGAAAGCAVGCPRSDPWRKVGRQAWGGRYVLGRGRGHGGANGT
eukprot:763619-Hanusia_phi.AAC.1